MIGTIEGKHEILSAHINQTKSSIGLLSPIPRLGLLIYDLLAHVLI